MHTTASPLCRSGIKNVPPRAAHIRFSCARRARFIQLRCASCAEGALHLRRSRKKTPREGAVFVLRLYPATLSPGYIAPSVRLCPPFGRVIFLSLRDKSLGVCAVRTHFEGAVPQNNAECGMRNAERRRENSECIIRNSATAPHSAARRKTPLSGRGRSLYRSALTTT